MAFQFHNADHAFRCPNRRKIRAWIHDFAAAHGKTIGELAVVFCSDDYLLEVNKTHLQHDYYTDIITFDYCEADEIAGDLMLSVDRIKANAKTHNQLFFNELLRVIIHGHLHLVGYKDKTNAEQKTMRNQEDHWIARYYERYMIHDTYDVIVVGAGHAGNEAAAAAANLGASTLLITMNMGVIGQMSCNPAMGGIAKGQIVREIDAMGGYSGIVSDHSAIQFRMLNRSKGPAMWSPRTQNDRMRFAEKWRLMLEQTPKLDFWQDAVVELLIENGTCVGVKTQLGPPFVPDQSSSPQAHF